MRVLVWALLILFALVFLSRLTFQAKPFVEGALSNIRARLGPSREDIKQIQQEVQKRPASARVTLRLTTLYRKAGRPDLAERWLRERMPQLTHQKQASLTLLRILYAQGRWQASVSYAQEIREQFAFRPYTLSQIALLETRAYRSLQKSHLALQSINAGLKAYPRTALLVEKTRILSQDLKRSHEARLAWEQAKRSIRNPYEAMSVRSVRYLFPESP